MMIERAEKKFKYMRREKGKNERDDEKKGKEIQKKRKKETEINGIKTTIKKTTTETIMRGVQ